jgi:hypothetical protein
MHNTNWYWIRSGRCAMHGPTARLKGTHRHAAGYQIWHHIKHLLVTVTSLVTVGSFSQITEAYSQEIADCGLYLPTCIREPRVNLTKQFGAYFEKLFGVLND